MQLHLTQQNSLINVCCLFMHLAEGLSKESFQLLQEPDLKELGFTMGPRKLILQWLGLGQTARTPQSVSMSSDDSSTPRSARTVVVGGGASAGSSCASSNQVFGVGQLFFSIILSQSLSGSGVRGKLRYLI